MEEKDFLKAIKLSKEELIEWLNEMYRNEKILKEIILKYEKNYNVGIKYETKIIDNPDTMREEMKAYYRISAKNFEYIRK